MIQQRAEHVDGLGCWCLPYIEIRRCPVCPAPHMVEVHHTGRVATAFKIEDGHP